MPADTTSATKQPLGVRMLERLVGRVLAAWVAADAVYGPDTWLRAWLEGRGMGYVLGIRASDHLEVASGAGRLPARALTGHLEAADWLRLSLDPPKPRLNLVC